jgi:hypothetical protein
MASGMESRWIQIEAKLQRAEEHFNEFESLLVRLREECGDIIGTERDKETGDVTYYVTREPIVCPKMRIVAGEALYALRSTLDHLVWHLIEINGGSPKKGVSGFPIYDTVEEYDAGKAGKIAGSGKFVSDIIDRAQPYKTGDIHLWVLNKLNNIDKHRLLIALAMSNVIGGLGPYQRVAIALKRIDAGLSVPANLVEQELIVDNPRAVRLKAGDELITVPVAHAQKDIGFLFDIAIYEPGVIEDVPFNLLFKFCRNTVKHIANSFRLVLLA